MAIAHVDQITDFSFKEENGRIKELTRIAWIAGIEADNAAGIAEQARAADGLPASWSTITIDGNTLVLRNRSFSLSDDLAKAYFTLEYSNEVDAPAETGFAGIWRGGTGLEQLEAEVMPDGITPITVTHNGATHETTAAAEIPRSTLQGEIV